MSSKKNRKRQKEGAEGTSPSLSAASSRSGTPGPLARPDVAAPGMLVVTNFLEKGEESAGSGEAEAPEGGAACAGGRDPGARGQLRARPLRRSSHNIPNFPLTIRSSFASSGSGTGERVPGPCRGRLAAPLWPRSSWSRLLGEFTAQLTLQKWFLLSRLTLKSQIAVFDGESVLPSRQRRGFRKDGGFFIGHAGSDI